VIGVAARTADAWNGWAMDAERFEASAGELRRLAGGRPVAPTWGGIALVGTDEGDLERLLRDRRARGLSMDVWQGGATGFRSFAGRLEEAGCSWIIVLPVGGEDRIDVVAGALRA
jgi:hypothetical protein